MNQKHKIMKGKEKDTKKANKRTDAQKEKDRLFISDGLIYAVPIKQMHLDLNLRNKKTYQLSYSQVYADVKIIMKEWQKERFELLDNEIDRINKTLDKMQQEAWESWRKSKELAKTKTKRESIDNKLNKKGEKYNIDFNKGTLVEYTEETGYGDTKYLDVVQYCIDKKMELFGLKKIRIDQFNRDVKKTSEAIDWTGMDKETQKIVVKALNLEDEFD